MIRTWSLKFWGRLSLHSMPVALAARLGRLALLVCSAPKRAPQVRLGHIRVQLGHLVGRLVPLVLQVPPERLVSPVPKALPALAASRGILARLVLRV